MESKKFLEVQKIIRSNALTIHELSLLRREVKRQFLKYDFLFTVGNLGEIIVPYFQEHGPEEAKSGPFLEQWGVAEQLAFAIRDLDRPFSESEGIELCRLLGLTLTSAEIVLKECVSNEKFNDYCREERQRNEF